MRKRLVFGVCLAAVFAVSAWAQEGTAAAASAWKYIAAGLAVGFGCIGGGIAIGQLGAAAMGAIAEDASLSGKALPYLGLAEGVCLWGFLVALLILLV